MKLPRWTSAEHREHFIRYCEMLESSDARERAEGATAASRTLRAAGLSWREVFADTPIPERAPRQPRAPRAPRREPAAAESDAGLAWKTRVQRLLGQTGALNDWERAFLADLTRFPRLSDKQAAVIGNIEARVARGARARSA